MGGAEALQAAGKKSWWREAVKAALLSAAMIGVLGACWAGAKYRKHVVAAYYGWRFARGDLPHPEAMDRLHALRPSRDVRSVAWRTAYALTSDRDRKEWAAFHYGNSAGVRSLYELVKRAGAGSPAESALFDCLFGQVEVDPSDPARYGFGSIHMDWSPPGENEPDLKDVVRYEFGSYAVSYRASWDRLSGDGEKPEWRMGCILVRDVRRLPGPWRELPPAPPRQELSEEDFEPL